MKDPLARIAVMSGDRRIERLARSGRRYGRHDVLAEIERTATDPRVRAVARRALRSADTKDNTR